MCIQRIKKKTNKLVGIGQVKASNILKQIILIIVIMISIL